VIGALPIDYFREDPEVARRVVAHDRAALEQQKPILSVDTIPIGGKRHERLAIRFPIFDRSHQRVEMTGAQLTRRAPLTGETENVAFGTGRESV